MTFGKCISGGESERVFVSPSAREMPPGKLKMRQLLGWTTRHSSSRSSATPPASPNQLVQSPKSPSVVRDTKITAVGTPSVPSKEVRPSADVTTNKTRTNVVDGTDDSEAPEEKPIAPLAPSSSKQQQQQQQEGELKAHKNDDDANQHEHQHRQEVPLTPPSPPPPPPSVVYRKGEKSFLDFHQHYAITRHLGEGSYSTVKQVTHRQKGGFFACKIVDKAALSAVDRAALSQEVFVLSRVSHANIMRLYEVIEDDSKCYLVTELAEHGDLFDKIVKQGKFPQREAQKVVGALTEALAYCHAKHIIHRDIKPENVLLSGENVKLCDFGFAKQLCDAHELSVDSCGTPGYAAPEILDGKPYGLEVDIFSLGVVTYIMLCGYPPFPMKLSQLRTHRFNVRFPSKDWGHVAPSVKELIAQMLHITPSQRPTAADLRAHPWVQQGRAILDQLRHEAEERKRLADLTRKQQTADSIRKKLTMGGFEVVKYGRNGLPHRTKLRFSNDARSVTWQPKLLKRSLLRYQNARSFTSLFGLAKESNNNSTSQPQLHAHPQVDRLSACDGAVGVGRRSESATHDADDDRSEHHRGSSLSSTGSNSSSASTASNSSVGEKKLWWKAFRRDRGKAERTASGGFSLSFSGPSAASFDRTRTCETDDATESGRPSAGTSGGGFNTPDKLDDAINLSDIRSMAAGDQSEFFAAHKANLPTGCKRAVDPGCVLSITTRFRELHLEFPNAETRDGFAFLLEQATLPLQRKAAPPERLRYANATRHSSSSDKEGDHSMEIEDARQFAIANGDDHDNYDDHEDDEEDETTDASESLDNNATESE